MNHTTNAPKAQPCFKIGVSRLATGKTGYERDKYEFGNSFYTERHTLDTLLELLTVDGFPVTMVHNHEKPGPAARKRGVTTYRHTENFVSMQVIFLDDDRAAPGVVDSWLADGFFNRWGAFVYESSSSRPEAEKCRPVFILDRPITDPAELKEIQRALLWKYPHVDQTTHDVTRVWYGAPNSRAHKVGNVLPYDVLASKALAPYRAYVASQEQEKAAKRKRLGNRPKSTTTPTPSGIEHYITKTLDGIVNFLASQSQGRHRPLYNAGRYVGQLEGASWTGPFAHLFSDVEIRIIEAAKINGYFDKYARGDEAEVLRTYNAGRLVGLQDPAGLPDLPPARNEQPFKLDPYELSDEAQARKAAALAEIEAEKEREAQRLQPHYAPGVDVGFIIADATDYESVILARQNFTNAAEWRAHVDFNYPELDSDYEFRTKLEENRLTRPAQCGRQFWQMSATGELIKKHMMCDVCEKCKKRHAHNLQKKLESILLGGWQEGATEPLDVTLIRVDTKADRSRWTRRLRGDEILYQVFPTAEGYDILAGAYLPEEGEILDPVTLTFDQYLKWVDTPPGERKSGKLIGNIRALQNEYRHREEYECDADHPDAVELILPGIVTPSSMPAPRIDVEIRTLEELQKAIFEADRAYMERLRKRGHVIYGVTKKTIFITPKTTLPKLIEEFTHNRVRQKPEPEGELLPNLA